jgi:streptomycin 3"-adenylyltransferase
VRTEVNSLVDALRDALSDSLIGIYLHGSLAMGSFNPARSDIDVLAVARERMSITARQRIAEVLRVLSKNPSEIEISVLTGHDLHPWRHPTSFDLHFSEAWRERYVDALARDALDVGAPPVDGDLAGHITVVRQRGIALFGPPASDVFPEVPREDYLDSVRVDVLESLSTIHNNFTYAILNACRTLAYLVDGAIRSKDEGGIWGLANLPEAHRHMAEEALAVYRGEKMPQFVPADLDAFAIEISRRITAS